MRRASKKTILNLWLGAAAVLLFGCSGDPAESEAFAPASTRSRLGEMPAQCQNPDASKAYRQGEDKGRKTVRKAWKRSGPCSSWDEFADAIASTIEELQIDGLVDSKLRKRCRYAGGIDGVFQELESIGLSCETECASNGELVGGVQAKAYCDLMIDAVGDLDPIPWIRLPVGTCGFDFEMACDSRFLGATRTYSNADGPCAPYVVAPYLQIWDMSRLRGCDFLNQESGSTP